MPRRRTGRPPTGSTRGPSPTTAVELFHPALPARLLTPLRAAGRLRVVEGETSLAPGVRLLHTPGHQSVLVPPPSTGRRVDHEVGGNGD